MWHNSYHISELLIASWQSIVIIGLSSGFSIGIGLILAVILQQTKDSKFRTISLVNKSLGIIVNFLRAIPFIILMIALIPISRVLVGSSIGINAAIVALIVAATPFYARIAESALINVDERSRKLGMTLGCSQSQYIFKILLPESADELIRGAAITIIAIIGYSAMAGIIGGGGLGQLAINYGYERFNLYIIFATIVLLVSLAQLTQYFGDYTAAKKRIKLLLNIFLLLFLTIFSIHSFSGLKKHPTEIRLGAMAGTESACLQPVVKYFWDHYHKKLTIIPFNDYALPNRALDEGDIDANLFQHTEFLQADIVSHHYKIQAVAKTFLYPLRFYSIKISNLADLRDEAVIAIPSDPTNQARALQLLQVHGLIKLASLDKGQLVSVHDIVNNPKQLIFKILDGAQLPRVLPDADLVAINNAFVKAAHLKSSDAIISENTHVPYVNVLVVKNVDIHKEFVKEITAAIHSKAFVKTTEKHFPGAVIGW